MPVEHHSRPKLARRGRRAKDVSTAVVSSIRGCAVEVVSYMKKTKQLRTAKSRRAHEVASGKPGGPTRKRLKQIAGDVMTHERRDRRSLDRHEVQKLEELAPCGQPMDRRHQVGDAANYVLGELVAPKCHSLIGEPFLAGQSPTA
jgi:hypothetical protein